MEIAFLIKGKKTKRDFLQIKTPEGIESNFGIYKAVGGNLYFATFSINGESIRNARLLSNLRDNLPINDNVRILRDDASAKFCENLYPLYCRFEKRLREALTIACCAEQGNFENKDIAALEDMTLAALYDLLFIDTQYLGNVRAFVNSNEFHNHADLEDFLKTNNECTFWNTLFTSKDMATFCERREDIRSCRNDVMHFHKMNRRQFNETRKLLKTAISEIENYIERARKDVTFAQETAENAQTAAKILNENIINLDDAINYGSSFSLGESWVAETAAMKASLGVSSRLQEVIGELTTPNSIVGRLRDINSLVNTGLSQSVSNVINALNANNSKLSIMNNETSERIYGAARAARDAFSSSPLNNYSSVYQKILDQNSFESLRQAALTSKDFNAGLSIGSAISNLHVNTDNTMIESDRDDDDYEDANDEPLIS